jgi:hypothetical protein
MKRQLFDILVDELQSKIATKWEDEYLEKIIELWIDTTNQENIGKSQPEIKRTIEQATLWFAEQLLHKLLDKYGSNAVILLYNKNIYGRVIRVQPSKFSSRWSEFLSGPIDFKNDEILRFFILHNLSEIYQPPN